MFAGVYWALISCLCVFLQIICFGKIINVRATQGKESIPLTADEKDVVKKCNEQKHDVLVTEKKPNIKRLAVNLNVTWPQRQLFPLSPLISSRKVKRLEVYINS